MADKKISQLTAATTPLDGTEVLPIVQSSATVKVANNDLRPKQIQSNATSGVLQIAGPAAASTRVMTTPDANFTAARTDAAQSFTGDQTLNTGNLIQGTAAKGFNFTANTGAAGITSQLLNWYEEGTWTPAITFGGASTGVTYDQQKGFYTRVGNMVMVTCYVDLSSKGSSTGAARIAGLPFTVANNEAAYSAGSLWFDAITYSGVVNSYVNINATTVDILQTTEAGTVSALTNTNFADGTRLIFSVMYRAK